MKGKTATITPANRAQALEARRKLKMASSAHAYVRGGTVQFYRWLQGHGKGDQLSREEAVSAARYLAEVVGKAHDK